MTRLFCIDIGNTRTHCAAVECARGAFDVQNSADYPSADFAEIFARERLFEASGASAICWCSVVPKYSRALAGALAALGAPAMQLTFENSPIPLFIDAPEQLGQDRIAAAVGAGVFLKPPYIVVDMGTAVTIDLVDAQGRYAGGAIAPGMDAFANYLGERAAQLPKINPARADCWLAVGKNTQQAMYVGCAKGFCRLVDALVKDIETEFFGGLSAARKTVFTGGSVDMLPPKWLGDRLVNRHLVHVGLAKSFLESRK